MIYNMKNVFRIAAIVLRFSVVIKLFTYVNLFQVYIGKVKILRNL